MAHSSAILHGTTPTDAWKTAAMAYSFYSNCSHRTAISAKSIQINQCLLSWYAVYTRLSCLQFLVIEILSIAREETHGIATILRVFHFVDERCPPEHNGRCLGHFMVAIINGGRQMTTGGSQYTASTLTSRYFVPSCCMNQTFLITIRYLVIVEILQKHQTKHHHQTADQYFMKHFDRRIRKHRFYNSIESHREWSLWSSMRLMINKYIFSFVGITMNYHIVMVFCAISQLARSPNHMLFVSSCAALLVSRHLIVPFRICQK